MLRQGNVEPYAPRLALDATSVYLTNEHDQANIWEILRIPRAGGAPVSVDSGASPYVDLAVDAQSIYWTEEAGGVVRKKPLSGGASVLLAASGNSTTKAAFIAVNAVGVYWATRFPAEGSTSGTLDGAILTTSLDGGTPVTIARTVAKALAVSASNVYWIADDAVFQVPIAGGTPTQLASKQDKPRFLTIDASHVYWTNEGSIWNSSGFYEGSVMRVAIGGGTPAAFARKQDIAGPLALTGQGVYWAVSTPTPTVVRLARDVCQDGACH